MDRRERLDDPVIAQIAAMQQMQAGLWTALPGWIRAYDPTAATVSVEPAIQAQIESPVTRDFVWINLPLLVDVPVVFPAAGGFTITFPIQLGDECLVVFASRCIDTWWSTSSKGPQSDLRLHDLSDGFALIGPRSRPKVIGSISTSKFQIRSDDGAVHISIEQSSQNVEITTPAAATINASTITINGDVTINGALINNSKNVGSTHKHGGVVPGGGNTGNPI